ncbi:MAG TPA: hypothetical protein VFL69_11920 [Marmoricola sp.]|nr:hypothetical protein [Marmoricola sp.]
MSFARAYRRSFLAALAALLALALGLWLAPLPAGAASTTTTAYLHVTSISSPSIDVPSTAGTPAAFVVAGVPFDVTVSFTDSSGDGGNPTTLPNGVSQLQLTNSNSRTALGVVSVDSTMTSVTFHGMVIGTAANAVTLSASVSRGSSKGTSPVPSAPFDVQITYTTNSQGSPLSQVGGTAGGAGCTPTPDAPTCADLLLPDGSTTSILMSMGLCTGIAKCTGSVVQALVGLDQSTYTRSNPATMIMKCDKTLCGGGGINKQQLMVQLTPADTPTIAPACPAKGTIGADQDFCVDYVQSTRDNAGDTYLYLLFFKDVRGQYT